MVMAMAITIITEARRLKSNNNRERVLLYGQKQHLCVGMMYFMMDDSVDEVGDLVSMRTHCGGYRYFKRFLDVLISGFSFWNATILRLRDRFSRCFNIRI